MGQSKNRPQVCLLCEKVLWPESATTPLQDAPLSQTRKQVEAILSLLGPILGGGATSPGHSLTSWAHLGGRGNILGGGANKSRPFPHFLGPSWGAGQTSPGHSHFLGPSWGAGQTSPGHSLTSWAHLGGRGKQVQAILSLLGPILVQAILSLLGPILGGGTNKSRPFSHFLGPS